MSIFGKWTGRQSVPAPATGAIRRRASSLRIQVGLDFGTSSTKVMFRRLGHEEGPISMDFGHRSPGYPSFSLPSLAAFDNRGAILFHQAAAAVLESRPWSEGLSRFKVLVAGAVDPRYRDPVAVERFEQYVRRFRAYASDCTPEALTASFLAAAMRAVRERLQKTYGSVELDIAFNICVPVDQRENNRVMPTFSRVFRVAELVEREAPGGTPGNGWLNRASMLLSQMDAGDAGLLTDDGTTRVYAVPEAVAGVAAYITSLGRRSGVHALVDIGAGTTEVSIFNVLQGSGQDPVTYWYASRTVPRGAGRIEEAIAAGLEREQGNAITRGMVAGIFSTPATLGRWENRIHSELHGIWHASQPAWRQAYGHFRQSSVWSGHSIQVFLAGGGALMQSATDIFAQSWYGGWGPYQCRRVPGPDQQSALNRDGIFLRLCVAYGLTTPLPLLGQYVLPGDCPDHTPPPLPRRDFGIDGDQLTPRYGWT